MLLLVAGGLAYVVIGPDGFDRLLAGKGLRAPAPAPPVFTPIDPRERQPLSATDEPPPQPAPPPLEPVVEPPRPIDDETRRAIDEHLALALEALRAEDYATAATALEAAADCAAGDATASERVARWQLLADHARQFPRHRDDALKSAGEGHDYEIGARTIGVVEVNDRQFIYRESGQNIRVPRNEIPDDILLAIVTTWFAGAGQAGNRMLLGACHVTRQQPDLEAARRAWSDAARRGEPSGRQLLMLLDDPVLLAETPHVRTP